MDSSIEVTSIEVRFVDVTAKRKFANVLPIGVILTSFPQREARLLKFIK